MNNTNNKNPLIELGVLWKRKSKSGEVYLTGKINLKSIGGEDKDTNLLIFSNKNKTGDKHPDLRVYKGTPPVKTNTVAPAEQTKPTPAPVAPEVDEELI
jgi:uncharacterized protein (DUF736 family)